MMKKMTISLALLITLTIMDFFYLSLQAESQKNQQVIDQVLKAYQDEGAGEFDPQKGKDMWTKSFKFRGKQKKCSDCHGVDLTKQGTHNRSGKIIKPMAAWVEPTRYTDVKKIEKWFKQNCKATWGRECTPQEKGDFLVFFRAPLD